MGGRRSLVRRDTQKAAHSVAHRAHASEWREGVGELEEYLPGGKGRPEVDSGGVELGAISSGYQPLHVNRLGLRIACHMERPDTPLVQVLASQCPTVVRSGRSAQLGGETVERTQAGLERERHCGLLERWQVREVTAEAERRRSREEAVAKFLRDHSAAKPASVRWEPGVDVQDLPIGNAASDRLQLRRHILDVRLALHRANHSPFTVDLLQPGFRTPPPPAAHLAGQRFPGG